MNRYLRRTAHKPASPTMEPGAFSVPADALIAGTEKALWVRADAAPQWQRLVRVPGFSCIAASADGQVLYVGTENGQMWRSVDGGMQWQPTARGSRLPWPEGDEPLERVDIHPQDPLQVYAVGRTGLYHSRDGGAAWQRLTQDLPLVPMCVAVDWNQPQNLWVGGLRRHLYHSDDGGRHWHLIEQDRLALRRGVTDIILSPHSSSHVYIAADDLYHTTDGGATWARLEGTWARDVYRRLTMSPADPRYLYVTIAAEPWQLYVSHDSGQTWTLSLGFPSDISDMGGVVADPHAALVAYAATRERGVVRTGDGGLTWHDWNDAHLTAQDEIYDLRRVSSPRHDTTLL